MALPRATTATTSNCGFTVSRCLGFAFLDRTGGLAPNAGPRRCPRQMSMFSGASEWHGTCSTRRSLRLLSLILVMMVSARCVVVTTPSEQSLIMPAGRYRYDDDHPQTAIKDLLLSDRSSGYAHPALYRLAERVVSCPACGANQGNPCRPSSGGDREARARRNHAKHKKRREQAVERMSRLLADAILAQDT